MWRSVSALQRPKMPKMSSLGGREATRQKPSIVLCHAHMFLYVWAFLFAQPSAAQNIVTELSHGHRGRGAEGRRGRNGNKKERGPSFQLSFLAVCSSTGAMPSQKKNVNVARLSCPPPLQTRCCSAAF